MCGRFSLTPSREALEARFGARFDAAWFQARYNAAPTQALPVILNTAPRVIQPLRWGLKPAWAQKMGKREGLINVRAETLRDRSTFTKDLLDRRCLVLADSFYEWKKARKHKIPYRIALKAGEPFAFAGLWEENEGEDGQPLKTFAVITTGANPLVGLVHTRMPVILRKEAEKRWIDYDITNEKLLKLLDAYSVTLMQMYENSTRVNRIAEDSPEIIKPVQEHGGDMLTKSFVDEFHREVRARGFNDADIAWMLKQHGVDSVAELLPQDARNIQDFAYNRRKYGRNLVEQWEKFTQV